MAFHVQLFSASDGHAFTDRCAITMSSYREGDRTVAYNDHVDVKATAQCVGKVDFVLEADDGGTVVVGRWRGELAMADPNAIIEIGDILNVQEAVVTVDLAASEPIE